MIMHSLTIFTPTYNRAHTLARTYESLCKQTSKDFEWLIIDDGSSDGTGKLIEDWIREKKVQIKYIYKGNGGLHTAYNEAIKNIDTELCVCCDSDDFLPEDAVEVMLRQWSEKGGENLAGIIGLDFDAKTGKPIGGYFPENLKEGHLIDLYLQKIHIGDTKQMVRTELMKSVYPIVGFEGEKNFNPIYLLLKIDDTYPWLIINRNLCFVDYQAADSMSAGIFRQYLDSPRSFAKLRLLEMSLKRNTIKNLIRVCIHYNSSCILAGDKDWFRQSPKKFLTIATRPIGWLLANYIRFHCSKQSEG